MKLFYALLLGVTYTAAHAQKFSYGMQIGGSFYNFYDHNSNGNKIPPEGSFSSDPNYPLPQEDTPAYQTDFVKDLIPGFFVELFGDWKLGSRWNISTGLSYIQKGINLNYSTKTTTLNPDNSNTYSTYHFIRNLRSHYVQIPAEFRYYPFNKRNFYFVGGIYNAVGVYFKIKNSTVTISKETYSSGGQDQMSSISTAIVTKAYSNRFDAGLIGGVGYEKKLNEFWRIAFEAKCQIGLVNLPTEYDTYGFFNFDSDTKNLGLNAGIKISRTLK